MRVCDAGLSPEPHRGRVSQTRIVGVHVAHPLVLCDCLRHVAKNISPASGGTRIADPHPTSNCPAVVRVLTHQKDGSPNGGGDILGRGNALPTSYWTALYTTAGMNGAPS